MTQLIWFKRDLRTHDHKPLFQAAQRGPVLPLYIIEPTVIHHHDFDPLHYQFIRDSLLELRADLAKLGQPLIVRVGEALPVLQTIHQQLPISHIWAHEETGNLLTFARDKAVRRWVKSAEIPLTELPQVGVIRPLRNRDNWAGLWQKTVSQPVTPVPAALKPVAIALGKIPDAKQLGLIGQNRHNTQPGGQSHATTILNDFLRTRADRYFDGLAKPALAEQFSSRLSPHLAWGTLSLRRTVQGVRRRIRQVNNNPDPSFDKKAWLKPLKAVESRLSWREHFMQKLEDQPSIETNNYIQALDGLREPHFNQAYFERWAAGQTGFPLVDAAMRAMCATGWINFRMRAMLVSFASYDLWLHWEQPAHHMARAYIDYEPGIHYSQMQMQAGTTGINTIRLYDPTKQALERDPNATFIRRWVPELTNVPDLFVHEPWRMTPSIQANVGVQLGKHYPHPIVDHKTAGAAAYKKLHDARQTPEALAQAQAVLQKHGSRRDPRRFNGQLTLHNTQPELLPNFN